MTEFTDKAQARIDPATDIGEDFSRVVQVEGHDEAEGETFEFTALKEGYLAEAEANTGEVVGIERITDSTSIGSTEPEYLRSVAEALEELAGLIDAQSDGSEVPATADADGSGGNSGETSAN